MNTREEQIKALNEVAAIVMRYQCNAAVSDDPADVVTLYAYHEPSDRRGGTEVVCALGGFDLWRAGPSPEPFATNASAEVAAQVVVDEYRQLKAEFVADRWIAAGGIPEGTPREDVVRTALDGIKAYQAPHGFLWNER